MKPNDSTEQLIGQDYGKSDVIDKAATAKENLFKKRDPNSEVSEDAHTNVVRNYTTSNFNPP